MVASADIVHRVAGHGNGQLFGDVGVGVPAPALWIVINPLPFILAWLPCPRVAPGEEVADFGIEWGTVVHFSVLIAQNKRFALPVEPEVWEEVARIEIVVKFRNGVASAR